LALVLADARAPALLAVALLALVWALRSLFLCRPAALLLALLVCELLRLQVGELLLLLLIDELLLHCERTPRRRDYPAPLHHLCLHRLHALRLPKFARIR
jgi:hypothetical protein